MIRLTINREFDTRVEKSSRVLEVSEAFGLGLSDKKFSIYENLQLDLEPSDTIYITGQSGSGKSLLLRDLAEKLREQGLKVMDIHDVPLLDMPLIDQIGATTEEGLRLLSIAGINDAYLFIRKPQELSDGQKYRFRLAKLIESDADVWIADEFAAVLDRDMAKIVAFNISKTQKALGKMLAVATTHTDIKEYLGATVVIEKLYGSRVELSKHRWVESHD